MSDREELERAMAALDGQRTALGDAAVEAALAGLREKLDALDEGGKPSDSLAGERRVVTVLFSDVKGSAEMAGLFDDRAGGFGPNRLMRCGSNAGRAPKWAEFSAIATPRPGHVGCETRR